VFGEPITAIRLLGVIFCLLGVFLLQN